MKKHILQLSLMLLSTIAFSQSGHVMHGVGAVNISMGGAATGQPIDISGALQWNPASISTFDSKIIKLDVGLFFTSAELSSSIPAGMMGPGSPAVSGTTQDDTGISPMPALAMVWGKEDSKHTFGASIFGVSGAGVTFPEETNNPLSATFNPAINSSPISYPQAAGGFGYLETVYQLLQAGFTYSYEISDKFSVGIQPTFNYGSLKLIPNPTAVPSQTAGYPSNDAASSIGFGAQIGIFFDSGNGFKAGASYKTEQNLSEYEFDNTYLDATTGTNSFKMNFPAIISVGLGYSNEVIDIAADYRFVDYENTDGIGDGGWVVADSGPSAGFPTGQTAGFGWKNMSIVSVGVQYKGIKKLPIRAGYTYNTVPIEDELTFFSVSVPAVINNAFQLGLSYQINDNINLDAVYHHGMSEDKSGTLLNPTPEAFGGPWNATTNPLGIVPGTEVSYNMTTNLVMVGFSYTFNAK